MNNISFSSKLHNTLYQSYSNSLWTKSYYLVPSITDLMGIIFSFLFCFSLIHVGFHKSNDSAWNIIMLAKSVEYFLFSRHCAKHFQGIFSQNPYSNPISNSLHSIAIFSSFFDRWNNRCVLNSVNKTDMPPPTLKKLTVQEFGTLGIPE